MANKQTNLTNSNPKLFSIYYSDGNDRQETYRFKAFDINDVVEYIRHNFFNFDEHFQIDDLEVDWQGEDCVYIMWTNPEEQAQYEVEQDEFYETTTYSFEIVEYNNPEPSDFSFNTIEGTNNYIDLTVPSPKQSQDWNSELAETWKKDPQKGCDLLQQLTLEGKVPK